MIKQNKKRKTDTSQRKYLRYNNMCSRQENNLSKHVSELTILTLLTSSLDELIKTAI